MSEYRLEKLRKLAYHFGKTEFNPNLIEAYKNVLSNINDVVFNKLIDHYFSNPDIERFPKPKNMAILLKKLTQEDEYKGLNSEKLDCFYCKDTGLVPAFIKSLTLKSYYIFNYACHCPSGKIWSDKRNVPQYFDVFKDLQFNIPEEYNGLDYPFIFSKLYSELNYATRDWEK